MPIIIADLANSTVSEMVHQTPRLEAMMKVYLTMEEDEDDMEYLSYLGAEIWASIYGELSRLCGDFEVVQTTPTVFEFFLDWHDAHLVMMGCRFRDALTILE